MLAPGWVPAEWTSTRVPVAWAWCRIKAAAIWDLPTFLTPTNNTLGTVCGVVMSLGSCVDWGGIGLRGMEGGHRRVIGGELGSSPQSHIDQPNQHGDLTEGSHPHRQGL